MEGQHFLKSHFSLEDIHQQIASLRRENRFLKFGLVLCLAIATLPYLAGFQPETIRAKRLITEKIEFVKGVLPVLSIDIHPRTLRLVISGIGGKPLVVLGERIEGGMVGVYDKDGKEVVTIDAEPYGGNISLRNTDGKLITTMGADLFGSTVSLSNKDGKPVASMSATERGGTISLYDEKGNPKLIVP